MMGPCYCEVLVLILLVMGNRVGREPCYCMVLVILAGRSGPIQGHDGWSVVAQQKQIRQSFEPSRMKITKVSC